MRKNSPGHLFTCIIKAPEAVSVSVGQKHRQTVASGAVVRKDKRCVRAGNSSYRPQQRRQQPFLLFRMPVFQIGAPATGREEANKSVTSPHQSFSIRVTPRISAPIAEASLSPYRPLWHFLLTPIASNIHIGRFYKEPLGGCYPPSVALVISQYPADTDFLLLMALFYHQSWLSWFNIPV